MDTKKAMWGSLAFTRLVTFWSAKENCDLTLICDNGSTIIPSALLASMSEKLSEIISFTSDKVLHFKNVTVEIWDQLVDVLMTGNFNNFEDNAANLYKVITLAYLIGVDDILKLCSHRAVFKKHVYSEDFLQCIASFGEGIIVEYNNIENDQVTKYQTTFTAEDLSGLVTFMHAENKLDLSKIKAFLKKGRPEAIIYKCEKCEQKCEAPSVICLYCNESVKRQNGEKHMSIKHSVSPSIIWPFTCNQQKSNNETLLGEIVLRHTEEEKTIQIHHKCLLCEGIYKDFSRYLDHYFGHGVFPFFCKHCGSVCESESFRDSHVKYCGAVATEVPASCEDENMENEFNQDENEAEQTNVTLLRGNVSVKQEPIDLKCVECDSNCSASSVQCMLCYEEVPANISHFKKEHVHSTQAKYWIISCDIHSDLKGSMLVTQSLKGDKFKCMICRHNETSQQSIVHHVRKVHDIKAVFQCKHCSSGFKTAVTRNGHQSICGGGNTVQCAICCKNFTSFDQLQSHKAEHVKESNKRKSSRISRSNINPVSSKPKPKVLKKVASKQSVKIEEPDYGDRFCFQCKCGECSAKLVKCAYCFKIVDNDVDHFTNFHAFTPMGSLWAFTCRFNSTTIRNQNDWVVFAKKRSGKNGVKFLCYKCTTFLDDLASIKKHMRMKHKISAAVCRICNMGFDNARYKKDHEHFCSGGMPVRCEKCNEIIGSIKQFKDHMRHQHKLKKDDDQLTDNDDDLENDVINGEDDKENSLENTSVSETMENSQMQAEEFLELTEIDSSLRSFCINCLDNCLSEEVKCLLCFKIVDRIGETHMTEMHPFCPENTRWIYTCSGKKKHSKKLSENYQISRKVQSQNADDENKVMYECLKCETMLFPTLQALQKHMVLIHDQNLSLCIHCESGFAKGRQLKDHEYFCNGKPPVSCTLCNKIIGTSCDFEQHFRYIHVKNISNFVTNVMSQNDEEDAEDDMKLQIDTEGVPKTQIAKQMWKKMDRQFQKRQSEVGVVIETSETPEERQPYCTNCSSSTCTAQKVKCHYCCSVVDNDMSHMEKCHPCTPATNSWVYTCRFIARSLLEPRQWMLCRKEIVKTADANSQGEAQVVFRYRCLKCDSVFSARKALLKHMDYKHKVLPILCVICESGFTNRKYLTSHEHYCKGGGAFKCTLCNKEIGNRKDYYDHMNRRHMINPGLKRKRKPETSMSPYIVKSPRISINQAKAITQDESSQENLADNGENETLPETELDGVLSIYSKVETIRTEPYMKMCVMCGIECKASSVKCIYCNEVIYVTDKDAHLSAFHPTVPQTSLWPVTCKFVKHQAAVPYILAKPIIEEVVEDPILRCQYECGICTMVCENSKLVENHLNEVHSLKVTFCKQCGFGFKKNVILEHTYFCSGGEMLKCTLCDKIIGGRFSAVTHRSRFHPINKKKNSQKSFIFNPKTLKKDDVHYAIVGNYGYNILSVDCCCKTEICSNEMVKCGLCYEIVPKDDIHMKLVHPYTPASTWVVYCKYTIVQNSKLSQDVMGKRVPVDSEEDVLSSPYIPCSLPFKYMCTQCVNMDFESCEALRDHVKSHHVQHGRRYFSCKHCETQFTNMSTDSFANHQHLCGEGTLFPCDFCDEVCTSHKALYYHVAAVHSKEKVQRQESLGIVKQENMEIPEGTEVGCSVCNFKSTNLQKIKKHCLHEHNFTTVRLNQVCRFCYTYFRTRSSREKHEQNEHLGNQKHLCDICGKDFDIPYQLRTHVYYFHKGGKEVADRRKKRYAMRKETCVCHHCGNVYKNSFACRSHIKNVHEKTDMYSCRFCSKKFGNKSSHKLHENRHMGNKTYKCAVCEFRAYSNCAVQKHIERSHPGVITNDMIDANSIVLEPVSDVPDVIKLETMEDGTNQVITMVIDSKNIRVLPV